jgi:hypothetical protein
MWHGKFNTISGLYISTNIKVEQKITYLVSLSKAHT